MSDKTRLTNAELELTQKIQLHFPRGVIPSEIIEDWNGQKKEVITTAILEIFGEFPRKPSILELIGTVNVPARTGEFIAKKHFVINTSDDAPVKISYLGNNFTDWLLGDDGKIEDPIGEQELRYARLKESSIDKPIIIEFGGEVKVETTLTEMFSLMANQPNGENGVLLANGYANIFYIRDKNGVLRVVRCVWDVGGWYVNAYSVEYPRRWDDGDRVFSRNSVS